MVIIEKSHYLNGSFKSDQFFIIWVVLLFFILGIIGIVHHEMWRDELQSWLIAKDSSSMIDLFNNLRYEGHPALWHICLYLITRFTHNPLAMQIFHLLLATSVIYVFINFSPFTQLQKILFTFGYFPFYEYNLISRSYSLGLLLIFIFCALYPRRKRGYISLSIVLALLANTHVYGLTIAIVLGMTLFIDALVSQDIVTLLKKNQGNIIVSLAIFIGLLLIAIWQMLPPVDADFKGDELKIQQSVLLSVFNPRLVPTLVTIWNSYIPIPNFFDYKWNINILNENIIAKICAVIFSINLLLFSIVIFLRQPIVLFLYLSGTWGILLFTYTKYHGALRHHGHLFIVFLVCIWLSSFYLKTELIKRRKNLVTWVERNKNSYLNLILLSHLIAGIFVYYIDYNYTFSASKEVASFIEQQGLKNNILVGSIDYAASPVAAFLDRGIYYPEINKVASFVVWKNRKILNSKEVLEKVDRLIKPKNNKAILILNYALKAKRPDMSISLLLKSSKSIAPQETYNLYLIEKK